MSYRCCSSGNVLVYYVLQLKGKSYGMSLKLYSLFTSKSKILKNYKNGESGLIYIYIICIIHPMMVNLNIEVNIIPAFQVQTNEQKEKVRAVRDERKKFKEIPEDLRKKHREHKENFERAREPLLQGLASKSDLKLFKEAQAKACEVLVRANSMTFYYYGVIFNFSHFCH